MHIYSVNLGTEQTQQNGNRIEHTGIYKNSTPAAVNITPLGLTGDHVHDQENHGGPDQAVYVYSKQDYDWWAGELGKPLAPGTFGENLTIDGLDTAPLQIGDRLIVGPNALILEVTAARIPCSTLASRMQDPQFVKRFRAAQRPGVYCRVIAADSVQVGNAVRLDAYDGDTILVNEMFNQWYTQDADEATLRRILAAPLAIRARRVFEKRLAELLATVK